MIIAGLKFRLLKAAILYNTAGVYIYKHKTSGKCFVKAMRNCRNQRSTNNYPAALKQYLKTNPSEIALYLSELPNDNKDVMHLSARAVADELSERGMLFKHDDLKYNIYRRLTGEQLIPFTVYKLTHVQTGAIYYVYEQANVEIEERLEARFKSFNNYANKDIVNPNRAMHYFTKAHYPLTLDQWVCRNLKLSLATEKDAKAYVTKLCRGHLQEGEVVLNRVCDMDVLYYRNAILNLPHQSMNEYLKPVIEFEYA